MGYAEIIIHDEKHIDALLALNMAIVFNMGTDLAGILSNPIGQPLATVRQTNFFLEYILESSPDFL